jgi:hypothetical protein
MTNSLICLLWMILIIVYVTVLMIINIIFKTWSWKNINYSMIGVVLSYNLRFNRGVIVGASIECT